MADNKYQASANRATTQRPQKLQVRKGNTNANNAPTRNGMVTDFFQAHGVQDQGATHGNTKRGANQRLPLEGDTPKKQSFFGVNAKFSEPRAGNAKKKFSRTQSPVLAQAQKAAALFREQLKKEKMQEAKEAEDERKHKHKIEQELKKRSIARYLYIHGQTEESPKATMSDLEQGMESPNDDENNEQSKKWYEQDVKVEENQESSDKDEE